MVVAESLNDGPDAGRDAPVLAPSATPSEQVLSSSESSDLSNKTILALVVLTLVVSFIGAWASISQVMQLGASDGAGSFAQAPSSEGRVGFSIERPPEPLTESASGMVAFSLTDGPGSKG